MTDPQLSPTEILGGDAFLSKILSQTYLHVQGAVAHPAQLMSWDDLNAILAAHQLAYPRLRLAANGQSVATERYSATRTTGRDLIWRQVQPKGLHEQLRGGASLVLDTVEELHPPVAGFAHQLERWLRTSIQANLYASWTPTEAFGMHWDGHDVIVVQLAGAKRWRLSPPTRTAPLDKDADVPAPPPGDPAADFVLQTGDLLYLPRGWWHSVTASEGTPSLHLTFGLGTMTGSHLLSWLADELRSKAIARVDLPVHASPAEVATYLDELRAAVSAALADPTLVERFVTATAATDRSRLRPSLPYVDGAPADPDVRVRLTTGRARLAPPTDGRGVVFTATDNEWEFAARVEPLLRLLVDTAPDWVTLGELAATAGLSVGQVATIVNTLLDGQVASLASPA